MEVFREVGGDVAHLRRRGGGFGGSRVLLGSLRYGDRRSQRPVAPPPPPLSRTPPRYEVQVTPTGVSPVCRNVMNYQAEQPRGRSSSVPQLPTLAQAPQRSRSVSARSDQSAPRRRAAEAEGCPVHCYRGTDRTRHDGHVYQVSFGKAPTGRGSSSSVQSLPLIVPGF